MQDVRFTRNSNYRKMLSPSKLLHYVTASCLITLLAAKISPKWNKNKSGPASHAIKMWRCQDKGYEAPTFYLKMIYVEYEELVGKELYKSVGSIGNTRNGLASYVRSRGLGVRENAKKR